METTDDQIPTIISFQRQRNVRNKPLDVLAHHSNHEIEQTHGFDEGESQNGVGEELTTQRGVAGNSEEKGTEDNTDTNTSTTETNGGVTHTQVLGDLNDGVGNVGRVVTATILDSEGLASVGLEESGSLLTLHGLERRGNRLATLGEGTLGSSSVELDTGSRASGDLRGGSGHGGSQARGENTRSGHCE